MEQSTNSNQLFAPLSSVSFHRYHCFHIVFLRYHVFSTSWGHGQHRGWGWGHCWCGGRVLRAPRMEESIRGGLCPSPWRRLLLLQAWRSRPSWHSLQATLPSIEIGVHLYLKKLSFLKFWNEAAHSYTLLQTEIPSFARDTRQLLHLRKEDRK